jgi:predicted RNase H-like HicB family nuclease
MSSNQARRRRDKTEKSGRVPTKHTKHPDAFGLARVSRMKARFTYWKESDGRYLGYLNDYPDHWTQGDSLEDLKDHLKDLFRTFSSAEIPGIRKVEELEVA